MEIYLVTLTMAPEKIEEAGIGSLSAKIIANDGMSAKSDMFDHVDECEMSDSNTLTERTIVAPAHMSGVNINDVCSWCLKRGRMVFQA